jgi:DUF1680 family protein
VLLSVEETGGAPWALSLRMPSWCSKPGLKLNGKHTPLQIDSRGYGVVERQWSTGDFVELELPMAARLIAAHPRIDPTRASVALERGPLVYCFESPDQPDYVNLLDIEIAKEPALDTVWKDDVLGGIVAIKARGYAVDSAAWADDLYRPVSGAGSVSRQPVSLVAIPYYAWDNRGLTAMRVWIPSR